MPLTGVTYRTVRGSFRRFTGGAADGTVTFLPSVRVVTSNDDVVVPDPIEATLDASGDFSVSLPVNDDVDMEPTGWTYLVIERIDGEKRSWSFALETDDGSPVDLADIAPVDPVSPLAAYTLVSGVITQAELDAEEAAREAADMALDGRVDALEVAPPAHAASHGNGGSDEVALDASQITTGTLDDARIPATITRDAELSAAVTAAVNALLDGAPAALDTLNELAAAVNDDASFAATVTAALAGKQPLDADLTTLAGGGAPATAWLAALLNGTYVPVDLSSLTASSSLDTDDVIPVHVDGALRKVTLADIATLIGGGGGGSGMTQEEVEDLLGNSFLVAGTNVTLTYGDNGAGVGTLTIDAAGGGGLTQEQAEDIAAALIDDNSDLDWTYDDGTASLVAVIKAGAVTNAMLAGSIDQSKVTNLTSDLAAKLAASSYTAADVLAKLVTVDGAGSGVDADLLDGANLSTDGTLAGNSDAKVPTEKAVKTYADQLIAAADAMVFKGVIDASASPNYPAADKGHTYRISVAGKIGGASGPNVEVGDLILALADGVSAGNHATVGTSWSIAQTNIDGAVVGPASVTDGVLALFDGTTGKLLKAGVDPSTLAPKASPALTGTPTVPDDPYDATSWNGSTGIPTKNAVRDKIEDILDGVTFTGDIVVPDEAYDATAWNGSLEVPTKNAVRDKIESLGGGGGTVDVVSNVAQDRILGRSTAGSGDSEELTADQAWAVLASGLHVPRLAVVSADVTHAQSNTTLSDVTGAAFTIGASATEIWFFEIFAMIGSASAAQDLKVGWSFPSGATMRWGIVGQGGSTTIAGFGATAAGADPAAWLVQTDVPSYGVGNTGQTLAWAGWVFGGGTGGSVQFRFAQNTSTAADLKVKAGSLIRYTKVAA